jgi:flagellar basal-body rod protein FlgG
MVRGFYSAASGMFARQKSIDAISNNIANASTAGYKSQSTAESSFGDHLVSRLSANPKVNANNIGPGSFMTINSEAYGDFTQGMMEMTGRSIDFAIQGEGFFVIRTEKYGDVLTRNGEFEIDGKGNLILPGVGKVLSDNKREINIKTSDFTLGEDGTIYKDGKQSDKLFIAKGDSVGELVKVGQGVYFRAEGYVSADKADFKTMQGTVEKANVSMAKELSKLISGQGHFQSCSQVLKIYDRINEITVSRIGSGV